MNDINNLLSNPNFNTTFGISGLVNRNIPSTHQYSTAKQVEQIINELALAARGQLKGQGAVSDFEGKMLKSAQTSLTLNASPENARKELVKVRGALTTSSGGSANVKVTDPKTGQSKDGLLNSAGITQAIQQGYQVEYQ